MSTLITHLTDLTRAHGGAQEPTWVYVVGPAGSGKSTILRMMVAEAVAVRPVIALQLQRDNSTGYAGVGATEFFDQSEFKTHVEEFNGADDAARPLLIIDGLGPADPRELGKWTATFSGSASPEVVCATNREDVTMSSAWGRPAFTIRVNAPYVRGLITGTIQRHPEEQSTYWETPLPRREQTSH